MSKRVPLSRCKRCIHYRGRTCPLQDLDPCRYTPRDPQSEKAIEQFLIAVATICICVIALCIIYSHL